MQKAMLFITFLIPLLSFTHKRSQEIIPVHFQEYGIQIRAIKAIGDTINYNKSSKEDFKIVFYDVMGKSYLEHYVNGQLYARGNYENSLDTLKRYVGSRDTYGQHGAINVVKYYQPLKDGLWQIYKSGKLVKTEQYKLGVIQE